MADNVLMNSATDIWPDGLGSRSGWRREIAELNIGAALKDALCEPGPWEMGLTGFGEILEAAGLKEVNTYDDPAGYIIGRGIHEMGTARMGKDPETSVLNKHNQVWDALNVFVTDGACMTSSACQNPSLTYMALTARAADFAVSEMKKQNL